MDSKVSEYVARNACFVSSWFYGSRYFPSIMSALDDDLSSNLTLRQSPQETSFDSFFAVFTRERLALPHYSRSPSSSCVLESDGRLHCRYARYRKSPIRLYPQCSRWSAQPA